jgi:hypothetical protein
MYHTINIELEHQNIYYKLRVNYPNVKRSRSEGAAEGTGIA